MILQFASIIYDDSEMDGYLPDLFDKIRSIREESGLSQAAFSQRLGVQKTKLQNIETGKQRIDHEFLQALAVKFTVDMNWLLDDTAASSLPDGFSERDPAPFIPPEAAADFVSVPRYDVEVSAGSGATAADETIIGHYAFSRRWLSRRNLNPDDLKVVRVTGDSMEPRLSDGDLAVVNVTDTELRDGVTYVFRLGNDLLVKRLQILPQSHVKLCSHNPEFEPILVHLPDGELSCVGRVVASMQEW